MCVCKLEIDLPRSHQSHAEPDLLMAFVLMKYHNFTNRKTGVLVLGDHDNSGAYLRNDRRLRSLKCAYIQDGADDCVFENDEGVLRLKWHGTWHHIKSHGVAAGTMALHCEFSYNGIGQTKYNKLLTAWPLFGYDSHKEALEALGLDLYGPDYKHRQCGLGFGTIMYDHPNVRNIDADIIQAARHIVLPPFIRAIRALDETVARELGRDRLALDREYQDAALALETSLALALCDWPVEEPVEPVESAPAASSVDGYL